MTPKIFMRYSLFITLLSVFNSHTKIIICFTCFYMKKPASTETVTPVLGKVSSINIYCIGDKRTKIFVLHWGSEFH